MKALISPFFSVLALCLILGPTSAQKQNIDIKPDIPYRTAPAGKEVPEYWKLDLAIPKKGKNPFPAVVCIHGGGWRAGNRKQLSKLTQVLAKKGFVAATISYRLSNVAKFPAQIEDCKAAVRFLRANAKKYRIDPERIGCVGFSAGGHLVCLLGAADKEEMLEGDGGNLDQSSRVQAVVSFFGPTDFIVKRWSQTVENVYLVPFLGGKYEEARETYKKASPLKYVSKDDPPFLFFHGDKDTLVGLHNSRDMSAALRKVGVRAELVIMEGSGHGWGGQKLQDTLDQTVKFFQETLKK